ncbi:hypothetical protein MA16_Dca027763 [Dendrobium catenatum]|uniref:Uncharacterized protein n=1 Tax=Dendrobium catenatum TaxID=906689 RepID=A0A2I0VI86_9ASPA|nr:hypothetical protein MA16_Dca027763 [Dendrobium catenatum]
MADITSFNDCCHVMDTDRHWCWSMPGNGNLYIAGGDDTVENAEAIAGNVVPGLQCKVWVQFENYDEFSNAMRALCGRSMQKVRTEKL